MFGQKYFAKKKLLAAVLALVPGSIGLAVTSVHAQQTGAAQPHVSRIHIKSRVFHLPIRIDRASLPKVREVCLYMKEGQGEWVRKDCVAPTVESFRCQMPRDGEYSFAVVTIDHQGNSYPADIAQATPAMIVVVGTPPPTQPRETIVTSEPAPTIVENGGPSLDSNTPPAGPIIVNGPATVTTTPISKNAATAPVVSQPPPQTIAELPTSAPTTQIPPPAPLPSAPTPPTVQTTPSLPPPALPSQPGTPVSPSAAAQPTTPAPTSTPIPPPIQAVQPTVQTPMPPGQPVVQTSTVAAAPTPAAAATASRQILNTTRVGIDYNIGRVGPSGLSKVEVWASQDQGRTWHKVGEDTDQRSPAEVDLPGEGTYGIRLVGTNGNGFGGKAPVTGDPAGTTIEVDLTSPIVHAFEVDSVSKNGALGIRWRVSDKNLTGEPINLFYASQRTGPWLPIAFKAKNEGAFQWTLPRDVPTQLFFRLEAADVAGNLARSETPNPIMLDMTEPDVNVTGITAMPQRSGN